jgi:ribosome-dependent ATPase
MREGLELRRDPVRMTLAVLGSVILLVIIANGINLDVNNLTFAVLDRDQTTTSQNYQLNIAGSRYFVERPPITDYADLDRRMRSGEVSLAIEIPPRFARDAARGRDVEVAAWIDGAMPTRGETIRGYVQSVHAGWIADQARRLPGEQPAPGLYELETRFRYNPGFASLIAMAPGFIPVLLMLIPAMLTALSVVREKELGSIVNLYVTPVTRLEFLLGKQIPYVVLSMLSALLLWACAVFVLQVPFTGSFVTFVMAALIYVGAATGFGLLISTFVSSQVAAVFGTGILTIVAAVNFCGMINPLSSMEGPGVLVGRVFPTTYFITISRGTFSKALGFDGLVSEFVPLLIAVPVLLGAAAALLPKQAR